jgi:hypothetical protein
LKLFVINETGPFQNAFSLAQFFKYCWYLKQFLCEIGSEHYWQGMVLISGEAAALALL